jgi:hypothetical protein
VAYDPTGTPIREQILDNIESVLSGITSAGSPQLYANTVAAVKRFHSDTLEITEFPTILVIPTGQRHSYGGSITPGALTRHDMSVVLVLAVRDDTWRESLHTLMADVRAALAQDHTRGGVALDTALESDLVYDSGATEPVAGAQLDYRISYRTFHDDPVTAK